MTTRFDNLFINNNKALQESKRNYAFDFIKGVLILLVILGHALQNHYHKTAWDNWLFNLIYSFHMPLFVMLSGFFFSSSLKLGIGDLMRKKFKRLLCPLLFWSSVVVIFSLCYSTHSFNSSLIKELYVLYTKDWFLICIFVLSVTYYIAIKNGLVIRLLLLLLWLLIYIFYKEIPGLGNCQIIRHTFSFGIGYLFSIYYKDIIKNSKIIISLISAVLILLGLNRLSFGYYIHYFPTWVSIYDGILSAILAFAILSSLYALGEKKKFLIYFGQNSLSLYVVHMVITQVFRITGWLQFEGVLHIVVVFSIYLFCSLTIIMLLSQIPHKYHYLFGL